MKNTLTKLGEAQPRGKYHEALIKHLKGGLGEFYKYKLGKKNGYNDWVAKWHGEWKALIYGAFHKAIMHEITGFKDRELVIDEVIAEMMRYEPSYRAEAYSRISRYSKLPKLIPLDDADTTEFWNAVKINIGDAVEELKKPKNQRIVDMREKLRMEEEAKNETS